MCRISPLLSQSDSALWVIAIIGAATAFFAATIAVAQNDIKKVLAYSTVSQLGYMFLAVGSGAYVAAIFHMVTHAFFKALLFLGSGSVIHGMHDQQDMRRMGALRKLMPITAATFIVGWLAIAGVPPFAGFWSKDDILLGAWNKSPILWFVGLVTALLTAYYMTRQVVMVFFGEARWREDRPEQATPAHGEAVPAGAATDTVNEEVAARVAHEGHGFREGEHPHESGWLMWVPLAVLAVLAILGGLLDLPFAARLEFLGRWLEPVVGGAEAHLDVATGLKWVLAIIATIAALSGLALGYLVYERRRLKAVEPEFLAHAWYYDEAVSAFMGGPGEEAFDGVALFDKEVVDGAVNGTGGGFRLIGRGLRRAQTGFVRNYALGIGVGAVLLLVWFVTRGMG
jgi:NADH-quinone oxidoreductase subunit L